MRVESNSLYLSEEIVEGSRTSVMFVPRRLRFGRIGIRRVEVVGEEVGGHSVSARCRDEDDIMLGLVCRKVVVEAARRAPGQRWQQQRGLEGMRCRQRWVGRGGGRGLQWRQTWRHGRRLDEGGYEEDEGLVVAATAWGCCWNADGGSRHGGSRRRGGGTVLDDGGEDCRK